VSDGGVRGLEFLVRCLDMVLSSGVYQEVWMLLPSVLLECL
jgi:hypothetical protein